MSRRAACRPPGITPRDRLGYAVWTMPSLPWNTLISATCRYAGGSCTVARPLPVLGLTCCGGRSPTGCRELELGGPHAAGTVAAQGGGWRAGEGRFRSGNDVICRHLSKPCNPPFVREWQNEVTRGPGDRHWRLHLPGQDVRSLSLIAKAITGTHQSGPRFFGIGRTDSAASKRRQSMAERAPAKRCAIYVPASPRGRARHELQLARSPERCLCGLHRQPATKDG